MQATQNSVKPVNSSANTLKVQQTNFTLSEKTGAKKPVSVYKVKMVMPGDGKKKKDRMIFNGYPSKKGEVTFPVEYMIN